MPSSLYAAPPGHLTLLMSARRTASFITPGHRSTSFYLYIPRSHPVTRRARGEDVGPDDVLLPPSSAAPISPTAGGGAGASPTTSTVPLAGSPSAPPPPPTRPPGKGPGPRGFPLLVVIHDSSRDAESLRDHWATLAEEEGCVVLSPHFPCDIKFPDGPDNYKRLAWTTASGEVVRYDEVLLSMIDTVAAEWGCVDTSTFSLVGFSGGGQFVLRFFYLYPEKLHAVSIGAPGRATPLVAAPWPEGIDNAPTVNGRGVDVGALRDATVSGRTKVHLLIGDEDTWRPVQPDGTRASQSRFDVIQAVRGSFDAAGLVYDYDVVRGAKHEADKIRAVAMPWVRRHVRKPEQSEIRASI
ncbi:uncharacterized protein LOC62_07G009555 [Vanrija pseudolonga]|uniref:Uncharacterized protein n=1 Tax=Vanrija pseudolonga TaxID=143232 RepID=A0AAF0YKJ6_9TREE|nr:hypothetical protein LOC62_07G009555 [Vanrija pseudolonga]